MPRLKFLSFTIVALGVLMAVPAMADDCVAVEKTVTLHGTTYMAGGCGKPNCDSSLAPRLVLQLDKPICLEDRNKNVEESIAEIQLNFQNDTGGWSYGDFPADLARKAVLASGTLKHEATGTVTPVVMNCTSLKEG